VTPEEKVDLDAWVEAITKIFSASFDAAARYANIFLIVGYGSFFGLWNLARGLLGRSAVLWAALLMLASITIFILHQLFNLYMNAAHLNRLSKRLLEQPVASLAEFGQRYQQYELEEKGRAPLLLKVWRPGFFLAVLTGLSAIGILAFALAKALWTSPALHPWP
jgi:hypothetical protein